jgi:phosphoserine aminotransferase
LRVHNFCAGPCTLPEAVLEEAQAEFVEIAGSGMSLMEMSHRGPIYDEIHEAALSRSMSVFGVPDDFEVLFIQGGATLQFSMVPMNLLGDMAGAYIDSGSWASKALADAKIYGDAYAAWDGTDLTPQRMPNQGEIELRPNTRYLHVSSNETIGGLRMVEWPEVDVPLIGDMSSDYMSRPIPWEKFDLVYGGVQKNLGPAGMAVVFIRKSVLEHTNRNLGIYLRYDIHADKRSLYNTPPVFTIWMTGKMLKWIEDQGGLPEMERRTEARAAEIYKAIDESNDFYTNPILPRDRSLTNVVFNLATPELEAEFISEAAEHDMVNLKGHRSVGGVRASLYNAMPLASVEALTSFMSDFASTKG